MASIDHVEFGELGEPVVGDQGIHPWIRCIGDEIVRYVRPSIEDPTILALRNSGRVGEAILPGVLGRVKDKLEMELEALKQHGVSVVNSTVEVCPIPVFDSRGNIVKSHLGLKINSELIDGIGIAYYHPESREERHEAIEEVNATFNGLERYVMERREAGEPPLSDIYGEFQYLYGSTLGQNDNKLVLVDTDPMFMKPSSSQVLATIEHINSTRSSLLRRLQLPHPL